MSSIVADTTTSGLVAGEAEDDLPWLNDFVTEDANDARHAWLTTSAAGPTPSCGDVDAENLAVVLQADSRASATMETMVETRLSSCTTGSDDVGAREIFTFDQNETMDSASRQGVSFERPPDFENPRGWSELRLRPGGTQTVWHV